MRLIDADALREKYNVTDPGGTFCYCSSILEAIDKAPTVETPRGGSWIPHVTEDGCRSGYDCSECGDWYIMDAGRNSRYCPSCGARMDKSLPLEGAEPSEPCERQVPAQPAYEV